MKAQSWKIIGTGIALAAGLAACTQTEKAPMPVESERAPAGLQDDAPKLVYVTYDKEGKAHRDEITAARWQGQGGGFSAGGREDYLLKFYYSNARETSLRGLRHASCFVGDANMLVQQFFGGENTIRNLRSPLEYKASSDGRMIGIGLDHNAKGRLSFRLVHCESGKSSIADVIVSNWSDGKSAKKITAVSKAARDVASSTKEDGFLVTDRTQCNEDLPTFKLRADYNNAPQTPDAKPWAGLNLRNPREALKFTLLVQKYFYENMANQNPAKPNYNFIAENNKNRFWCHMPWMQVGTSGRESIHGMTKERDLVPSTQIPIFKNATPGSDWGVAYFNNTGCNAIEQVFGNATNPKPEPEFNRATFGDGTVIIKMLFTTANFPEIQNAYKWRAAVSEPGATERSVKDVRHIQMDIAVKDASLKGSDPALGNWVMSGFYYDPDYDFEKELKSVLGEENPLKSLANIPKELFKMRPMGVQIGFDTPEKGDTVLFAGAYTNGSSGRLNGPADNPKTSCLGCHGAAGTGAKMVPGFLSFKMFEPYKTSAMLDFNQQFALAKENFETDISRK